MVGSHISLSPGCHHITNDQPMHYSREIPPIHHIFAFFDKSIYNDPYKITGAVSESNPLFVVNKKSTASKLESKNQPTEILGPHRGVPGTKRGLKFVTPRYDSTPKNLETWQKQVDMKNYSKRLFGTITIQVYCIYINECVIYIFLYK